MGMNMKRLTWILLATLPTVVMAEAPSSTSAALPSATEAPAASTQLSEPTANTTTTDTSVNAAGLPLSGSNTTSISSDPAATIAPVNTSGSSSGSNTTAISADPTATAAAPAKVGPRPGGPNKGMLPEEFKVYYSDSVGISKTAFKGSSEKVIPTVNEFTEVPGCYISCFTKDPKKGIYSIGDNHYLIGQIRVSGHYYGGNCLPKGFENKDVRTATEFKEMCEKNFPEKCEKASCGVVADYTAQWFN